MLRHPLFTDLEVGLANVAPRVSVELGGEWSSSQRRVYESAAQQGTGSGPFVLVTDLRWSGTITCAQPIAGVAFLLTPDELFWVKSAPPALTQPVEVSLHARADHSLDRATFSSSLGGAVLPGVPVGAEESSPTRANAARRRPRRARSSA